MSISFLEKNIPHSLSTNSSFCGFDSFSSCLLQDLTPSYIPLLLKFIISVDNSYTLVYTHVVVNDIDIPSHVHTSYIFLALLLHTSSVA